MKIYSKHTGFLFSTKILLFFLIIGFQSVNAQTKPTSKEDKYANEITQFAREDKKGIDTTNLVVFIGSSTLRKWTDMQRYFPKSNILNHGFGGSRLAEAIYFADKMVYQYKPTQVVLYEGDNDLGGGISVEALLADLKVFVRLTEIKLPKTQIVLLSVKYSPHRNAQREQFKEYNAKMKEFAATKPNLKYVDIASVVLNENGTYRKELFTSDSLHVNADCYKLFAKRIEPFLIKK
ncbi:MAG: GDSL-type esterase/lipase family protein [Paludibacter sp.]